MSSSPQPRLFTLQEAQALLPILEPLLRTLQNNLAAFERKNEELDKLVGEPSRGSGHYIEQESRIRSAREELEQLTSVAQQSLHAIQKHGCELKDVRNGLLDFRAFRDGRVVYLCWRQSEPEIAYWHELDTGFAGRQPL